MVENSRKKEGIISGIVGVVCNLFLCAGKFAAGMLTGSVSIMTDAINNLSDSGSSVVTIFSFMFSSKKADREHPHGHGRFEYVASFIVGFFVLFAGFQFLVESIKKIITPSGVRLSVAAIVILSVAVAVKLFMMVYYRIKARKLNSSALKAAATDSMFDVLCTSVVLLSFVLDSYLPFRTDGICGAIVSLFVLFGGGRIVFETIGKLLGNGGDAELFKSIYSMFEENEKIVAAHDLKVHEYGQDICIGSVHAEMDKSLTLLDAHDIIQEIEKKAKADLKVELVVHIDPVDFSDPVLNQLRKLAYVVIVHYHGASVHDVQVFLNEKKICLHVKLPSRYESMVEDIKVLLSEQILKDFEGFDVEIGFEMIWK